VKLYLSPPHLGTRERELVDEAFATNWIAPLGPHVDAFEREVAAISHRAGGAALSSGTAALHLALQLLGVGRDDEVLCSTLTFAASANPIAYLGARPVFIDSERQSWNLDPDLVEEELAACARRGKRPRALVTVDLYGQCADYDRLLALSAKYDVPIIEDSAEALGATYRGKPAGSFGALALFSFNGNKIITSSGGGMLVGDRLDLLESARHLATQARDPAPHYQHSKIGYNYRLSNVCAAIGRGQLSYLAERVAARRANNAFYREALGDLPGIDFLPEAAWGKSNCWLTVVTVDPARFGASREDVRVALEKENVEARPVWKPMHLQPVFSDCRVRGGEVAAEMFDRGLCLPSGSSMTRSDLHRVAELIRAVRR
jgi:dTDP-4-amino-4,6-dideoxygalactose transaminase